MPPRNELLSSLIGEPWAWRSRNCRDFPCHVERELFGRELPHVVVPAELSKRWILEAIERHPERAAWCQVALTALLVSPQASATPGSGNLSWLAREREYCSRAFLS